MNRPIVAGTALEEAVANIRERLGEMAWGIGLPSPFVTWTPDGVKEVPLNEDQAKRILESIFHQLRVDGPPDFVKEYRDRAEKAEALVETVERDRDRWISQYFTMRLDVLALMQALGNIMAKQNEWDEDAKEIARCLKKLKDASSIEGQPRGIALLELADIVDDFFRYQGKPDAVSHEINRRLQAMCNALTKFQGTRNG